MVNSHPVGRHAAPGRLEDIRELLNTWRIPNDIRQPVDRLADYAGPRGIPNDERRLVRRLRDDLRHAIEHGDDADERLNGWVSRLALAPSVSGDSITYRHRAGVAGDLCTIVLEAIGAGEWRRLKACPDCRFVFFDQTRNAGRRWCTMTAGDPEGRSCGSISKVRRYRERHPA